MSTILFVVAKNGILYATEIVEEKYQHKELPDDPTNSAVNKNVLLLCLTNRIHTTGKEVVLISGLCIR